MAAAKASIDTLEPRLLMSAYTIAEVPTLGAVYNPDFDFRVPIIANAMNNSGEVVGVSRLSNDPNFEYHGFYFDGTTHELPPLAGGSYSEATDVNSSGVIVGNTGWADGTTRGFYFDGAMHDLGLLGGTSSSVQQINDAGQIAGFADTADGLSVAFIYANGTKTPITLGGNSTIIQMNEAGHAFGTSYLANDNSTLHAFYYDGSTVHDLGADVTPICMNASDVIAGTRYTHGDTQMHGFTYDHGTFTEIPNTGGFGMEVVGINDSGKVIGYGANVTNSANLPYLWDGTQRIDLPTLGGNEGFATQINSAGQFIGDANTASGVDQAYFYDNGSIVPLALSADDQSTPVAINDKGQAIGWDFPTDGSYHSFLYDHGTLHDLNDLLPANSGWDVTMVYLLDQSGQIYGYGTHNGQAMTAFLMTPTPAGPVQVDPTTIATDLPAAIAGTSTGEVDFIASSSDQISALVGAINNQSSASTPVTIKVDLGGQTVTGQTLSPASGITVEFNNGTFDPDVPAMTVTSGHVIAMNCTFTTTGDAPTILITGGELTLRNSLVQESDGAAQVAIKVTGGTLDLGTTADPGANTLEVRGAGEMVLNTGVDPISAVGTSFVANGVAIDQSLQGRVWVDLNNDAAVDFNESGINGVTVTLSGTDDLGAAVQLTTTTSGGGNYAFSHVRPGTYRIVEGAVSAAYVQGSDPVGTLGGSNAVQDTFSGVKVGVNQTGTGYNFGEQPAAAGPVGKGQSASVGFWQNKSGQALITSFGSGLGNWLASTLPNVYGKSAGGNNLAGWSSAAIAAYFKQKFALADKLDAQLLAAAFNVYATSSSLGGSLARAYGFSVSTYGLATATWNVGADGAAFGVSNGSTLTVMQILNRANSQATSGVLYGGNMTRRKLALDALTGINNTGGL